MNNGLLEMVFSETVRRDAIRPEFFTFQNVEDLTTSDVNTFTLTGGVVSEFNSKVITVQLTKFDIDGIKQIENLGTTSNNTFMTATSNGALDMTGLELVAIPTDEGVKISDFWFDTTDPTLLSFEVDMDKARIVMSFSETIDVSTFKSTEIRIQENNVSISALCDCLECTANFYNAESCTTTVDTTCQGCKVCEVGQFVSAVCEGFSDTICEDCGSCSSGQFVAALCKEGDQTDCGDCGSGCTQCAGPGALCLECETGFLFEGECKLECPDGYYAEANMCAMCDTSCSTCSGPKASECDSCSPTMSHTLQSTCESPCYDLQKFRDNSAGATVNIAFNLTLTPVIVNVNQKTKDGRVQNIQDSMTRSLSVALQNNLSVSTAVSATAVLTASSAGSLELTYTFSIDVDQAFYADIEDILMVVAHANSTDPDVEFGPFVTDLRATSENGLDIANVMPVNTVKLGVDNMCTVCDSSCKACTGNKASDCTLCPTGSTYSEGFCNVGLCVQGYFEEFDICHTCPAGCTACSNSHVCTAWSS
jgi:hypothetical protein